MLWDVDHTLLNAGGVGPSVYREVFRDLFGREPAALAPMAGRTERAIIRETLNMAGIDDSPRYVDTFMAELTGRAAALGQVFAARGRALPGAADALAALAGHAADTMSLPAGPARPERTAVRQETAAARPGHAPAQPDGPPNAPGNPAAAAVQSVLTGNIRAIAEAKLAAAGLTGHLDLDIGAYGDHHEVRAELVHLARRQAYRAYGEHFAGAATVLIGDTPLDVAAALATGARAVGVATGDFSPADLADAGAHAVLPGLTDTTAVVAAVLGAFHTLEPGGGAGA